MLTAALLLLAASNWPVAKPFVCPEWKPGQKVVDVRVIPTEAMMTTAPIEINDCWESRIETYRKHLAATRKSGRSR